MPHVGNANRWAYLMNLIEFLKIVGVDLKSWQIELLERYLARKDGNAQQSVERTRLKDGGKMPEIVIFDEIRDAGE